MSTMASQIISLTIIYSTVYSGADQRKHQNSTSLAFVRGIHREPVNSPHKGPVTRKMFPFDDVIMYSPLQEMQWGTSHHMRTFTTQPSSVCWTENTSYSAWRHAKVLMLPCRIFLKLPIWMPMKLSSERMTIPWWVHENGASMVTSYPTRFPLYWGESISHRLLALCEGNPPATVTFPTQKVVIRSIDVLVEVCLNELLKKEPSCLRICLNASI